MDIVILISAVSANLILGLFVYLRKRHSATNSLFFLLTIDVILWSIANYLATHTTDLVIALTWIRIVMFLAVPQAVLFFLLIHTLPQPKIILKKNILYPLLALMVLAMILCLSPFVFSSVIMVNNSPSPTPGPAIPVFAVVAIGSLIAGIYTLIRKFRQSHGKEKLQIAYILTGMVIMFGLILFFNFFMVVFFKTSSFVAISPLYTFPFIATTGYAIIKHRFLDIGFVVTRTVSYTLVVVILGLIYALIITFLSIFFFDLSSRTNIVITSTIVTVVIALSFQSIRHYIEKITDKALYHDRYDQTKLLYSLTAIMATTLRFEELTHNLLNEILTQMRVVAGAFILIDEDKIYEVAHEGYSQPLELKEETIINLLHKNESIIFDELPEDTTKEIMRKLNFRIIMPMYSSEKEIGLIALGPKKSGEIYFDEDIKLLEIFVPEAAVAISNSIAYEEIRRFNITLTQKVEQATAELRAANERLLELDKLKDEFVSLASHELRTPMTAIKSYIWMALKQFNETQPPQAKSYLTTAYQSTERLLKLVEDMLTVSRIEAKRLVIKFEPLNIVDLIKELYKELKISVDEKKINFTISTSNENLRIQGDRDRLKEVVQNLISNALKFTPSGGTIKITVSQVDNHAEINIFNSGSYIAEQDISKLFQKFVQLNQSRTVTGSRPGSGLGLYICKQIVEIHKGTISASSEKDKGTSFKFTLPLA